MKKARDAAALRKAIKTRGLSYRQLGLLADCSRTTPYLLLQGKTTNNELAARLAKALGQQPEDLFVDAAATPEQDLSKQGAAA